MMYLCCGAAPRGVFPFHEGDSGASAEGGPHAEGWTTHAVAGRFFPCLDPFMALFSFKIGCCVLKKSSVSYSII